MRKILLTAATLALLGAGCAVQQSAKVETVQPAAQQPAPTGQSATLLQDAEFGLTFFTTLPCKNYLKVTKSGAGLSSRYTLTLPLAVEWSGSLLHYSIMSKTQYDVLANEDFPGQPIIRLDLGNNLLLTAYDPQDVPPESDLPSNCSVEVQKK